MTFRSILVATDFSEGSQNPLRVATRLAVADDAALVIAHVWNVPTALGGELPVPSELVTKLQDDAAHGLEAAVKEAKQLGARRVATKLLHGTPTRMLLATLDDPTFDLIVVGTHGRTGLSRILIGSIAEGIVRHAPCSVLVVRPDNASLPFSHILCPIDFSPTSRVASRVAEQLADTAAARLTLFHVVEIGFDAFRGTSDFVRHLETSAQSVLDKEVDAIRRRVTVPVDGYTATGSAGAQTLARLDDDSTIDLVVMGTHGRSGLERAVFGSVAAKVVRHARCPVLVARDHNTN